MNPILLIVDDEPSGRDALESVLINQGYTLRFAASGSEAVAMSCELSPDVILLDVMMPGMDGFEVCRRLRQDPCTAEVPILMITALDDRDSLLQGIESGADDFITKPIDRALLRARLRTITRLNRYRRLKDERAKLERQLSRLTTLRAIDLAITTGKDLRVMMDVLLQHVTTQLNVDAAAILLYNPQAQSLQVAATAGFQSKINEQVPINIQEDHAAQVVQKRCMVQIPHLNGSPAIHARSRMIEAENFHSYFGVPLLAKGDVEGILEIYHRSPLQVDEEWLDFLSTLAGQATIAIDNSQLFEGLQRSNTNLIMAYDATIEGWSHALDLRDKETEGHSQRVTEMTLNLARIAGMSAEELVHVRRGALLHDIGKLGIPDEILFKEGSLSGDEWETMRKHPAYAYALLSRIAYLLPALDIPYCHHEKWDGTGYPRQLCGNQIPLAARIFAVVDVWDALHSDRPYRTGWPDEKICAYIQSQAGLHFDPYVVRLFLDYTANPSNCGQA